MRIAGWFLLAALPAIAQIQLFVVQPQGSQPVGASVNLGSFATNEPAEIRFRVTNGGASPITLASPVVSGAGFSLQAGFPSPDLPAGASTEFSVRFFPTGEGSYSCGLAVNAFSTILRAAAVAAPAIAIVAGGQSTDLQGSLQLEVATGETVPIQLAVRNPHDKPINIDSLTLTGVGYELAASPPVPLSLAPGQQLPVGLVFQGVEEREYRGMLQAGARRLQLIAVVQRPKLGVPRIVSDAVPRNGRQLRIRLEFPDAARVEGTGTLRVTFTGANSDSAIQFMNGSRQAAFRVPAGSRTATFDGAPEAVLQTGTSTGTLRLEATTESGSIVESYTFAPSPIVVDAVTAVRNGSNLEVSLSGFDNTRSAGSIHFRFFDRAGAAIGGVITATLTAEFRDHFARSEQGGVFRLRAVFPVNGDAGAVGSVVMEIANAVGRTDIPRAVFP